MKIIIAIVAVLITSLTIYFYRGDIVKTPSQNKPVSTITPSSFVPQNWKTYQDKLTHFTISYPNDFEVTKNGEASIMIVKKVNEPGQGPSNFLYISVAPDSLTQEGVVYNYSKRTVNSLLSIKVNETKSLDGENAALREYVTYKRFTDRIVGGKLAKVFINEKPWEFPAGTREYRYIIEEAGKTYVIGGYISTTGHNNYSIAEDLYNQILTTLKL